MKLKTKIVSGMNEMTNEFHFCFDGINENEMNERNESEWNAAPRSQTLRGKPLSLPLSFVGPLKRHQKERRKRREWMSWVLLNYSSIAPRLLAWLAPFFEWARLRYTPTNTPQKRGNPTLSLLLELLLAKNIITLICDWWVCVDKVEKRVNGVGMKLASRAHNP